MHLCLSFRIWIRICGKMKNNLIVIENGQLNTYLLDTRLVWEVGRMSKDNIPDITMHATTISRKHGKFQNMDGIWFYMDYKTTNKTLQNGRVLTAGLNGRVKPVMVSDGDVFVFGCGEQAVVSPGTVWSFFSTKYIDAPWKGVDSRGCERLLIVDGDSRYYLTDLQLGEKIEAEHGTVIYMGNVTYVAGDVQVMGKRE